MHTITTTDLVKEQTILAAQPGSILAGLLSADGQAFTWLGQGISEADAMADALATLAANVPDAVDEDGEIRFYRVVRDVGAWEIDDQRSDKTVPASDLFASCEWADRNADDYRADYLGGNDVPVINDGTNYVYELTLPGCTAYVHRGEYEQSIQLVDAPITWAEYLRGWDTGDATLEELLADFGVGASSVLDEADESYDGACKVWVARNYYAGTLGAPKDGWARDEESYDREAIVFPDFAAARAWVDGMEDGPYYCGNGEAGRPDYTICKA